MTPCQQAATDLLQSKKQPLRSKPTLTHLGAGVHGEAQLGLLAVVHRQALQQEGAQAGAGTTTNSVEHQEALQASAVVCQLADAVQGQVNNLLANCRTGNSTGVAWSVTVHRQSLSTCVSELLKVAA
jgi:hypothetical protein